MTLTKEQQALFDRYGVEVSPGEPMPDSMKAAVVRRRKARYTREGVLSFDVLPYEPLPAGAYLVHNHVRPQKPLGKNGFRAWIQHSSDRLVECRCDLGGCKNSKVHKLHYRVDRGWKDRLSVPKDNR